MTLVDKLAAFKNTAAPLRRVSETKVLSFKVFTFVIFWTKIDLIFKESEILELQSQPYRLRTRWINVAALICQERNGIMYLLFIMRSTFRNVLSFL